MTKLLDLDDVQLVERCREGSDEAWRALIVRYRSLVYTLALRTGLDEDAAAEVFQQVWTELHRSLARLREPKALPRWLAVSTRRLSYRYAVNRSRWVDGTFEEMVDSNPSPQVRIEQLEDRRRIDIALDTLGDPCAKLIRLLFFQTPPLDYPEIARRTKMARGSIGPTRARCLERLRKVLSEG